MIQYCKNCLLPSTKPDLSFNTDGVCAACTSYVKRERINWESRETEFLEIVDKHKSKSNWDLI